jgi:UDP-N-acetylmuramoylalanine--D-glutamate ligase
MTRAQEDGSVAPCGRADLEGIAAGLAGLRVTLMGLGLFGGGEGAARFLCERGARLTVTDLRPAETLAPVLERLCGLPATYHLGAHHEDDFTEAQLIVASPAVPRTSPFLRAAQQAGVPITSPMNLFLTLCPAPVAAVTGSNGKSTTTALLAAILKAAGRRAWLGGNIGISLLPSLAHIGPGDVAVLELSSFQLQDAAALCWSPHVAVVTNITPNHLDRHLTLEEYAEAKRTLLRFQGPDDYAVLNARDARLRRWAAEGAGGRLVQFDVAPEPGRLCEGINLVAGRLVWHEGGRHEVVCARDDVPLLGLHNTQNAMAACAAARCLDAGSEAVRAALRTFMGLEHRLELVGVCGGIRFYNDSYSTTPAAGVAAVQSFRAPLTLIAGGYDKKLDLTPFAQAAARSVEVLITVGQTGPVLAQQVRQESAYLGRTVCVREAAGLPEAVRLAEQLSMPGSVVVLSPGCASYDMFENYDHRGKVFKELVRSLCSRGRPRRASA